MEKFKVKKEHLTGQIKDFPLYIVQRMVDEQVLQGNVANPAVFAVKQIADQSRGGFTWRKTALGHSTWSDVITRRCFHLIQKPKEVNDMKQFKIKKKHLTDEIKDFPKHVVQQMVGEQVLQGNKANPSVFAFSKISCKSNGGFDWEDSALGHDLWNKVINNKCFDLIPKPEKPKGKPKAGTTPALTPNEIIKAMLDKGMTVWAVVSDASYDEARSRMGNFAYHIVEYNAAEAYSFRTASSVWKYAVPVDTATMTEITEMP